MSSSEILFLYIEKKLTGKFYLIKAVALPPAVAFVHDEVSFNNKANE